MDTFYHKNASSIFGKHSYTAEIGGWKVGGYDSLHEKEMIISYGGK